MSAPFVVSAPGKLMVAGEYVVLDDAPCLVAAVDRRLYVTARADGVAADLPPEARATRALAEEARGETPLSLSLDADALRSGDVKLGLGSSAAASAAVAAAVIAYHGRDPASARAEILDLAIRGHRAIAPEGSGADVAASTLGGLVRFRRAAPTEASSHRWPAGVRCLVVWTGSPARTSDLVRVVRAFRDASPAAYDAVASTLAGAAAELSTALLADDPAAVVAAADAHGEAMRALGDRAGAQIVEASLDRVMKLAKQHRGGAKPSGAGGGDVALAFFERADDAARFEAACPAEGLTPIAVQLGEDGVRHDPA